MYKENNTLISSAWWQCSDRNDLLPCCYKTQVRDSATRPTVPYRDTSPDMFQGRELSTWRTFRCSRPGAYKRHSEAVKNGSIKLAITKFFWLTSLQWSQELKQRRSKSSKKPKNAFIYWKLVKRVFFCILYNYKSNKNIITKKLLLSECFAN